MEQSLSSTTLFFRNINYWLSDHPTILNFRWSVTQTWGSTWLFLITSIFFYTTASLVLHHILSLLLNPRRSVPLGPIPALHSLTMALVSLTIFAGAAVSSAAEIRETRWLWHRSKTPLQWFLCFPLGTRPSVTHVLSLHVYFFRLVRIFSIFSSVGDFVNYINRLDYLRVQVLDVRWFETGKFSTGNRLSGGFDRVQLFVPFGCAFLALSKRRVQWNRGMGFQLRGSYAHLGAFLEFLPQNAGFKEKSSSCQ
ncbi:hypothetical protein RJ641_029045 [Dillenia turbinata]|uniref:Uncharacterized protein n=1 Tax=Dillenia turbinata TaxID=194707 RepID=A0AAN8VXG4_9MAGN